MTLPSGKVLTYGYTIFQPKSISISGQTILSGATYDPFGAVNGWTWGNGSFASRNFDLRGLMNSHSLGTDTRNLGYDPAGQVTSMADTSFDVGYDYDLLGRLTGFSNNNGGSLPDAQAFSYDANGNRSSITENGLLYSYTYLIYGNRLLSTAGPAPKTYSYDASGNVLSDSVHSYGYDDRGRLVSVDLGAATYEHNGLGQRVKKQVGASSTLFVYDQAGQLIGEYDGSGAAIQETVWFNGAPVAVLQGTNRYYVHTDHLGTPRAISNGNTVIWRWESDPFGTTAADEDADGDLTPFTYHLRFPGQYYDAETGLHYNYFRTYDPSTGRYLESDPIGLQGGLNSYAYASANPLLYYDPYGLFDWPSLPQVVVDSAAGLGDGLSGGLTAWLRDQAGISGGVNKCASAYSGSRTTGNVASLTLGGGRLVYAGIAKGYSVTASSGAAASAGRSGLRRLFGGGGSLRPPDLSRYPTDAALREAAGRTNPLANAAGAAAAGLGANDLANGDECECSQ